LWALGFGDPRFGLTTQLWSDLRGIEQRSVTEILRLWGKIATKADVMREALATPHERGTALRLLLVLGDEIVGGGFPMMRVLTRTGIALVVVLTASHRTTGQVGGTSPDGNDSLTGNGFWFIQPGDSSRC